MQLFIDTEEACDEKAALEIVNQVKSKPDTILGLATGSTPIGMYQRLVKKYQDGEIHFDHVRTFNLDEYVGLPKDHPCSYYYFMQKHLFKAVDLDPEASSLPDGTAADPEEECMNYEKKLEAAGGIDLQVLGIGRNGHIGFNEPGTPFNAVTHVVPLTQSTIDANARFFDNADQVPRRALSMGIKTIMHARKILLIAKGEDKADAVQKALQGPITPNVPASILQLHPNITVIVDHAAAGKLKKQ
ncbi:glucosamine-6-phosphate deaminase [Eubacteriales bacterium mix99]